MITLEGIAKQPGIAIAVAAAVDARSGINGVSHALLETGIASLKSGLPPADFPEAIIACDTIVLGFAIKIPGINSIGYAAESDADVPGLAIDIPCVIGATGLLESISEGDIIIVDGYKGLVHIDPDTDTLIHYQQAEEHHHLREKVFIASEHIPARTASGELVYVYALLSSEFELNAALDAGADGLVFDLRGRCDDLGAVSGQILREAAGKPVVIALEMGCEEVLRAAMVYCTPGQLTLVSEDADFLAVQVERALDHIVLEALQLDIDPPQAGLGRIVTLREHQEDCSPFVIDARDAQESFTIAKCGEEPIVVVNEVAHVSEAIADAIVRRIAVAPGRVTEAKLAIRSIGLEEEA